MRIDVKGAIVSDDDKWIYDLFGITATSPSDVHQKLSEAKDIEVNINSGGGDVYSGSEIYTALKNHKYNVTVNVVGIAASAASVIAMGGDTIKISPTAQIMIHNASTIGIGDKHDMEHISGVLASVDETIANAYQIKTGLSDDEILDMMSEETWLTPKEAKEKGFVDEIMFENNAPKLVASFNNLIPEEVIKKVRNNADKFIKNNDNEKIKAELQLLKLKERNDY